MKVAVTEDNTTLPVLRQKSHSETSNKDINNNEIYYPESNVYFENYHLTTPKNRVESSDVTFEEVL